MQLFNSISASLLLLGCVSAGAASAEARAAQALQQTATHSAQALEALSARGLASIDEAVTSAEALGGSSERSLASGFGGSSERSLASVDSEAAQASERFFEEARVKERIVFEEEEAAYAALQAVEGTAAVHGFLNLENLDRGLVGALGDEKRTASLVKVLKGETRGTLKFELEEAAKRSPAVKEALEKASVTHPELAPILESA